MYPGLGPGGKSKVGVLRGPIRPLTPVPLGGFLPRIQIYVHRLASIPRLGVALALVGSPRKGVTPGLCSHRADYPLRYIDLNSCAIRT
jgi:hypothetical protein